jgi:hypothetical protein
MEVGLLLSGLIPKHIYFFRSYIPGLAMMRIALQHIRILTMRKEDVKTYLFPFMTKMEKVAYKACLEFDSCPEFLPLTLCRISTERKGILK